MAAGDRLKLPGCHEALELTVNVSELRNALRYDPSTGVIVRIANGTNKEAGHIRLDEGGIRRYRVIKLFGKRLQAHRIAWAIYYGRWPFGVIDHIDGDGTNNRIDNLRECSNADNIKNRKLNVNSVSGFKGVHKWSEGLWRGRINANGRRHCLGFFRCPVEAARAYDAAAIALHGKFARTNAAMGLI